MQRLIEQIISEVKHAQILAGVTDYMLAERLCMSAPAFSTSKSKGFGKISTILLYRQEWTGSLWPLRLKPYPAWKASRVKSSDRA